MTLPAGFRIRVRSDVHVSRSGRLLIGGSPPTVLRLAPRAAAAVPAPGKVLTVTDDVVARVAERLLAGNLADPLPGSAGPLSELTVVVPVHDRPEVLDRCLAALGGSGLHVIVVDDRSPDPVAIAQVAGRHGADLIRHSANKGPAAARNTGLRSVRTPFAAFVDADVQAGADDLGRLLAYANDPRLALIAPRILSRATTGRPRWWERYDLVHGSLDRGQTAGQVRAGAAVPWLPSACLVGRTAALGTGFDAGLRVGEDVDLVWRLLDAGQVVRYAAEITVRHDTRDTLGGWLGRKVAYGTSAAPLTQRHPDRMGVAVLAPPQVMAAAALALPGWWTPLALLAATGLTARRIRPALADGAEGRALAGRLAVRASILTAQQTAGLLLRHWWPVTLTAAPFSAHVRRAVVVAIVVDLVGRRHTPAVRRARLGPVTHVVAARLDDAAYGLGLWLGAWRARSVRPLLPRIRGGSRS